MRQLPNTLDRKLLVGTNTADDAGVYRLDRDRALVQTVDFFTPIVDDPYLYGQIAAANALSDVYAMGGRPLTALNVMGVPDDIVGPKIIASILKGAAAKAKEAACCIVGGHTIRNPEPIFGLAVTGLVRPSRLITNAKAKPGDLLLLTKPLGTGIVTTGIKRNIASASLVRKTITSMRLLNRAGADLGDQGLVKAGTDITGFGLLGHLISLCRASRVGAEIDASELPLLGREVIDLIDRECIPGGTQKNLSTAEPFLDWGQCPASRKVLMADAQTSGGLLLCVAPRNLAKVLRLLARHRTACVAHIGRIVRSSRLRVKVLWTP